MKDQQIIFFKGITLAVEWDPLQFQISFGREHPKQFLSQDEAWQINGYKIKAVRECNNRISYRLTLFENINTGNGLACRDHLAIYQDN